MCGMPGVTERLVAHLRRCAECGHIGGCDSCPSQHASKHAAATGHPIIVSFEPGEDWFFDYEKGWSTVWNYFRRTRIRRINLRPAVRKSPSQLGITPALAGVSHFRSDRYGRRRTEDEEGHSCVTCPWHMPGGRQVSSVSSRNRGNQARPDLDEA